MSLLLLTGAAAAAVATLALVLWTRRQLRGLDEELRECLGGEGRVV